jgi:spore germination protein
MMKNENNAFMTSNQIAYFIFGTIIGTEVLFFPNLIVEKGRQDAWICAALGAVYPIFMVIIANFMASKFPHDNILNLSKKYLGKILGGIANVLFILQFVAYTVLRSSQFSNMVRVYSNYFLSQRITIFLVILVAAYTCSKGLKPLTRLNQVIFYFALPIALVPAGVFMRGTLFNLLPVFKVSPLGILQGSVTAARNYFGIEIIFLIYPFMKNTNQILKAGLKGTAYSVGITVWFTLASIYYFGTDVMPKNMWVVMPTTNAFRLVTIKNFVFIFLFFWIIVILKNISNTYYSAAFILKNILPKIDIKIFIYLLAPLIFYLALKCGNEVTNRSIMKLTVPYFISFDLIYVTLIAVLIKLRKVN